MDFASLFNFVVLFIFILALGISAIFTFSVETYRRLSEKLNISIYSGPVVNYLDTRSYRFDDWVICHRNIIGPILIIFSLVDLKLCFDVIKNGGFM